MINIVIPSYKRAGNLKGYKYFNSAKIVIPESQRDEYNKYYETDRLIVIDDKYDGNIARKRNWILNNINRPLLMIDDDVSYIAMGEGNRIRFDKSMPVLKAKQQVKLESKQVEEVIYNGFLLCEEWGCKMWGINVNVDGRNYKEYKPFSLSKVILGPFQGHLNHDCKFDEKMGTKDDYDMSIQMLNRYRKILRIDKYSYSCEHGNNKGGIVSNRSLDIEIEYCKAIMKKWGSRIIKYRIPPKKQGDLLNGIVNIPIGGV